MVPGSGAASPFSNPFDASGSKPSHMAPEEGDAAIPEEADEFEACQEARRRVGSRAGRCFRGTQPRVD